MWTGVDFPRGVFIKVCKHLAKHKIQLFSNVSSLYTNTCMAKPDQPSLYLKRQNGHTLKSWRTWIEIKSISWRASFVWMTIWGWIHFSPTTKRHIVNLRSSWAQKSANSMRQWPDSGQRISHPWRCSGGMCIGIILTSYNCLISIN